MSERLPLPDIDRIERTAPRRRECVELPRGTVLLRLHPLSGSHGRSWNQFRHFGPTSARFDHHPPPPQVHQTHAVMYCAVGAEAFVTAVAEYFQDAAGRVGPIDRSTNEPTATAFTITAPIRLLDLRSGWVTRAGGNQAIVSGRCSRSRAWARAIHTAHGDIDGLLYPSSVWSHGLCIALWERCAPAVPGVNDLHRLLSDPVFDRPLAHAAELLGTVLLH